MNQNYLIPVSIIIAGAFIGIGVALSGNSGTANPETPPVSSEEVPEIEFTLDAQPYQFLGSEEAPVTIIEYADFACPFCHRNWRETFPQIKEQYIDTGIVQYVYRDFPVVGGEKAAEATHCAAEQGQYWEYHDLLFSNHEHDRSQWSNVETHRGYAQELGLDGDALASCFSEGRYESLVAASLQEAIANQGQGTPYFLVNGIPIGGAQPFEIFQEVIQIALERVEGEEE